MPARILVVGDDLLNRMFYHEVLESRGYEAQLVADVALVMDEVARFRPQLITMDIQLPHVSGLRLIRRLREDEETRDTLVIAITAFAGKGEEERAMAAGASAYLSKPVTVEKLSRTIADMLPVLPSEE